MGWRRISGSAPRRLGTGIATCSSRGGTNASYHVTLGEPSHANVTGEAAYVVLPAEMRFRLGDAAVTQTGAVFTTALQRSAGGWRIVAWAWAKGRSAAG